MIRACPATAALKIRFGRWPTVAAACNGTATTARLLPAGRDFSVTSPGDTAAMSGTGSVASWAWPIVHASQTVGRLEVLSGEGRLIKTLLELLDSFADQAGLAFHNAWLQAELAARAEAIEAEPRAGRVAAPGW